jgi:hypothetical protein
MHGGREKIKEVLLTAAFITLIQIAPDVWINPEHVKVVRAATSSELQGHKAPLTKIILIDNIQVFVEANPTDIVNKLKEKTF